jgi:hypothetical protein
MKLLLLILSACAAVAQSVGSIANSGTNVVIRWTNTPPCSVVEASSDLATWSPYLRYEYFTNQPLGFYEFTVPKSGDRWFWRLRPCDP